VGIFEMIENHEQAGSRMYQIFDGVRPERTSPSHQSLRRGGDGQRPHVVHSRDCHTRLRRMFDEISNVAIGSSRLFDKELSQPSGLLCSLDGVKAF
jgi:hypothetical protein